MAGGLFFVPRGTSQSAHEPNAARTGIRHEEYSLISSPLKQLQTIRVAEKCYGFSRTRNSSTYTPRKGRKVPPPHYMIVY